MLKFAVIVVVLLGAGMLALYPHDVEVKEKIDGISLVSPREPIPESQFNNLASVNPNYVAIIPYAFTRKSESNVIFNHPRQWWGERPEGVYEMIRQARHEGLKTMLKPHVWVGGDGWPGDMSFSEVEWTKWERDYKDYILTYASIADSASVDLFCIGTEVRWSVKERPEFWIELIKEVKSIYSGPVTYAANWDNYQYVTFWDQLDYIGIDAYFPLDSSKVVTLENLEEAWQSPKKDILAISQQYDKPILFTEFGYRSVKGAAGEDWKIEEEEFDEYCQSICYQAIFNTFWEESWFAGGFLWKWHFSENVGGEGYTGFTPQGKMAMEVINNQFSNGRSAR